ncbi:MAG: ParB N-terminal domain-containing protein, partial [Opitutae bacterium]|nr:ParB N-terminal domain-containing protein [Opitutae bacterium]
MAKASSRLGRGLGSLIAGGTAAKAEDVSSSKPTFPPISIKKESIKNSPEIVDRDLTNDSDEENLFSIPIESIVPNPYQPRKVIDPDAIRELASSI